MKGKVKNNVTPDINLDQDFTGLISELNKVYATFHKDIAIPAKDLVSVGSKVHIHGGICRPCSFLWKLDRNCRHGIDCSFCHMHRDVRPAAEKKIRKAFFSASKCENFEEHVALLDRARRLALEHQSFAWVMFDSAVHFDKVTCQFILPSVTVQRLKSQNRIMLNPPYIYSTNSEGGQVIAQSSSVGVVVDVKNNAGIFSAAVQSSSTPQQQDQKSMKNSNGNSKIIKNNTLQVQNIDDSLEPMDFSVNMSPLQQTHTIDTGKSSHFIENSIEFEHIKDLENNYEPQNKKCSKCHHFAKFPESSASSLTLEASYSDVGGKHTLTFCSCPAINSADNQSELISKSNAVGEDSKDDSAIKTSTMIVDLKDTSLLRRRLIEDIPILLKNAQKNLDMIGLGFESILEQLSTDSDNETNLRNKILLNSNSYYGRSHNADQYHNKEDETTSDNDEDPSSDSVPNKKTNTSDTSLFFRSFLLPRDGQETRESENIEKFMNDKVKYDQSQMFSEPSSINLSSAGRSNPDSSTKKSNIHNVCNENNNKTDDKEGEGQPALVAEDENRRPSNNGKEALNSFQFSKQKTQPRCAASISVSPFASKLNQDNISSTLGKSSLESTQLQEQNLNSLSPADGKTKFDMKSMASSKDKLYVNCTVSRNEDKEDTTLINPKTSSSSNKGYHAVGPHVIQSSSNIYNRIMANNNNSNNTNDWFDGPLCDHHSVVLLGGLTSVSYIPQEKNTKSINNNSTTTNNNNKKKKKKNIFEDSNPIDISSNPVQKMFNSDNSNADFSELQKIDSSSFNSFSSSLLENSDTSSSLIDNIDSMYLDSENINIINEIKDRKESKLEEKLHYQVDHKMIHDNHALKINCPTSKLKNDNSDGSSSLIVESPSDLPHTNTSHHKSLDILLATSSHSPLSSAVEEYSDFILDVESCIECRRIYNSKQQLINTSNSMSKSLKEKNSTKVGLNPSDIFSMHKKEKQSSSPFPLPHLNNNEISYFDCYIQPELKIASSSSSGEELRLPFSFNQEERSEKRKEHFLQIDKHDNISRTHTKNTSTILHNKFPIIQPHFKEKKSSSRVHLTPSRIASNLDASQQFPFSKTSPVEDEMIREGETTIKYTDQDESLELLVNLVRGASSELLLPFNNSQNTFNISNFEKLSSSSSSSSGNIQKSLKNSTSVLKFLEKVQNVASVINSVVEDIPLDLKPISPPEISQSAVATTRAPLVTNTNGNTDSSSFLFTNHYSQDEFASQVFNSMPHQKGDLSLKVGHPDSKLDQVNDLIDAYSCSSRSSASSSSSSNNDEDANEFQQANKGNNKNLQDVALAFCDLKSSVDALCVILAIRSTMPTPFLIPDNLRLADAEDRKSLVLNALRPLQSTSLDENDHAVGTCPNAVEKCGNGQDGSIQSNDRD